MTTEQWLRIQPVISEALALNLDARAAHVDRELGLDRDLLGYARRIVRLASVGGAREDLEEIVSGWRVILPMGTDGMGSDYLAERADGTMDRIVAFKTARIKMEHAADQQQWVQDIRQLTMLYDANIARILDSGWVSTGQPFVVSEFESGRPITEVAQGLATREKLTIFLRVLTAVGYAHQRKIVHGDLKPANVLVTREHAPRLLDFGLARVFAKGGDPIAAQTNLHSDSLAYTSPEQIRGKPIDEATDVYALGVIYYEMLSGRLPYGQPGDSVMERGRAICEKIAPKIEGVDEDLNYIAAKAMEKNREARYPNVVAMGKDVESYLEGRIVMPREEDMAFFALRLLKQNWITAALILGVLAVALVAVFQQKRALSQANQVDSITGALMSGIKGGGAKATAGESSVQSAKKYLDDMLEKNAGKPEVVGELAKAYLRLAEVELKGSGILTGNRGAAIQSARKAYEITAQLMSTGEMSDAKLLEFSKSARMLSDLLNDARDYKEAIKVTQLWKDKLMSVSSTNPELLKAKAAADAALADLMFAAGDQQSSMPFARSAMRQFGSIFESDKGNAGKAADYGRSANNVGNKALRMGNLLEALNVFKTAEAVLRPQASKPESQVEPLLDLAKTLSGLGETLEKSKQGDQAMASYKEARQLLEQAAKNEAGNEEVSIGLADNLIRTARIERVGNDFTTSIQETERAVEILRRVVGMPGSKSEYRKQLAQALTLRGELAQAQKKATVAMEAFEEAATLWVSYGRLAGLKPEDEIEITRVKRLAAK